jgi:hypothetical protein
MMDTFFVYSAGILIGAVGCASGGSYLADGRRCRGWSLCATGMSAAVCGAVILLRSL